MEREADRRLDVSRSTRPDHHLRDVRLVPVSVTDHLPVIHRKDREVTEGRQEIFRVIPLHPLVLRREVLPLAVLDEVRRESRTTHQVYVRLARGGDELVADARRRTRCRRIRVRGVVAGQRVIGRVRPVIPVELPLLVGPGHGHVVGRRDHVVEVHLMDVRLAERAARDLHCELGALLHQDRRYGIDVLVVQVGRIQGQVLDGRGHRPRRVPRDRESVAVVGGNVLLPFRDEVLHPYRGRGEHQGIIVGLIAWRNRPAETVLRILVRPIEPCGVIPGNLVPGTVQRQAVIRVVPGGIEGAARVQPALSRIRPTGGVVRVIAGVGTVRHQPARPIVQERGTVGRHRVRMDGLPGTREGELPGRGTGEFLRRRDPGLRTGDREQQRRGHCRNHLLS